MAGPEESLYEVEEMLVQPGTYFNPKTEVVVIVDDSASPDQEIFESATSEGAGWIRVSDEIPVDEDGRDRVLESFEARSQGGAIAPDALEESDDDFEEEEERPQGVPLDEEE
jgi:hypothetical protein